MAGDGRGRRGGGAALRVQRGHGDGGWLGRTVHLCRPRRTGLWGVLTTHDVRQRVDIRLGGGDGDRSGQWAAVAQEAAGTGGGEGDVCARHGFQREKRMKKKIEKKKHVRWKQRRQCSGVVSQVTVLVRSATVRLKETYTEMREEDTKMAGGRNKVAKIKKKQTK